MAVIQFAIPFFLALIVVEVLAALRSSRRVYRLADSLVDMSCGMISQFANVALKLVSFGAFAYVAGTWSIQERLGVPAWPETAVSWIIVFILVDFGHYWVHRISHRVNILWAGHAVHHSSEELNFTVAVRNSSLHGLFIWVFFIPLALLGVPWYMFAVSYALNVIYQFWLHTRLIGRLGWLEWVLNTPSHHRVHHGVDREYLDKNYAGVFIVWDRLFGTFQAEEREPHYGITTPPGSWNPVWANVHVFVEIAKRVRHARGVVGKLRMIFGPPELLIAAKGDRSSAAPAQTVPVPRGVQRYVLTQFGVALVATLLILRRAGSLSPLELLAVGILITVTLSNIASLLEGKQWPTYAELLRHLVVGSTAILLRTPATDEVSVVLALLSVGSLVWLAVLWPSAGRLRLNGRRIAADR